MEQNQLEITIDLDDYSAGLFGKLYSNNFCGVGEGWFNLVDIKSFIEKARDMLESIEGTANLVAGQNKTDGTEYLERFGLRCYPIGKTGTIGIHVTLTDYPYTDCRPEEVYKVSGELKSEIQLVDNFLNELANLISGNKSKAILLGKNENII